ncbi:rod-binding protein [Geomonas propionica]|uniref:Rod-binding protein n=1 Tax=Geomonas propionica TaxID=2798582 RepID=A0ABS0YTF2_9BACT|nr:rod-binding protein [Geomonas propionica]MBJ6801201.1 rod-binding protein [Geomonas propionica]
MEVKPIPDNALPVTDLRAQKSAREQNPEQIKKVAREFEAMFVSMMLKSMRDTVGKDTLTGGGKGEETFRSLLDQEYANAAVQGGGIGLAQTIERELARTYGAPAPAKGVRNAD